MKNYTKKPKNKQRNKSEKEEKIEFCNKEGRLVTYQAIREKKGREIWFSSTFFFLTSRSKSKGKHVKITNKTYVQSQKMTNLSTNCKIKSLDSGLQLDLLASIGKRR